MSLPPELDLRVLHIPLMMQSSDQPPGEECCDPNLETNPNADLDGSELKWPVRDQSGQTVTNMLSQQECLLASSMIVADMQGSLALEQT
ncbi:hypothetical protein [Synechococcus sp. MIT S1220]|uniref:hypothetical protein n=1 Tax=Synechococcus sp. MIT S1220 TaxID=3082549 RepID=UPI0039AF445F